MELHKKVKEDQQSLHLQYHAQWMKRMKTSTWIALPLKQSRRIDIPYMRALSSLNTNMSLKNVFFPS